MAAGEASPVPESSLPVVRAGALAAAPVEITAIPPFSPIAIHLLNIASQENVGLNQLAGFIRADPGMSVEVLRLANSPMFGARREITGILHAIAMLGLNRIKSMVMTVAIRDFLAPVRQAVVFAPCWRHCLATAFLCEAIAAGGPHDPDNSYTAGLLHKIGQLALIAVRPAEYQAIVQRSREEDLPLGRLERECFGLDHAEVGLRLLEKWKMPRHFQVVIDRRAATAGLAALVETACRLAEMIGFRVSGPDEEFERSKLPALPAGMLESAEELDELITAVATKINTVECSLTMV